MGTPAPLEPGKMAVLRAVHLCLEGTLTCFVGQHQEWNILNSNFVQPCGGIV
jgi:hypothetical protein